MKVSLRAAFVVIFLIGQGAHATCPDPVGVEIYSTAKVLPHNLLRVYVYYPRPMRADEGLQHVRVLDAMGQVLEGIFLTNRADLWSPDRRRLTLLLDPGRVKTGLHANAALVPALVKGRSYVLDVSGAAADLSGCALGADTHYGFTVGAADTAPPDPAVWALTPPGAHSMENLHVDLGSAHDHLSLAFRLRLLDDTGNTVSGKITLGPGERTWAFTPKAPWSVALHRLVVDERLEDLAGNRPGRPFDRPVDQEPRPWDHRLTFTPTTPTEQ